MEINSNLSEKAKHDLVLVEQAMNGDQKAFADLHDRYRDAIYFMLLKMVSNKSDAEDLTIEAFGKAFRSLDTFTPSFAFSTWLFKIATNNCIDFIRKKQASPSIIDQGSDEMDIYTINIQADTPDPEEELINRQRVAELREVVSQLKPRYKRLVELRYYKEYSYEEISKELNLPIGTIKAQLFRAKTLLYNILNKKGTR